MNNSKTENLGMSTALQRFSFIYRFLVNTIEKIKPHSRWIIPRGLQDYQNYTALHIIRNSLRIVDVATYLNLYKELAIFFQLLSCSLSKEEIISLLEFKDDHITTEKMFNQKIDLNKYSRSKLTEAVRN